MPLIRPPIIPGKDSVDSTRFPIPSEFRRYDFTTCVKKFDISNMKMLDILHIGTKSTTILAVNQETQNEVVLKAFLYSMRADGGKKAFDDFLTELQTLIHLGFNNTEIPNPSCPHILNLKGYGIYLNQPALILEPLSGNMRDVLEFKNDQNSDIFLCQKKSIFHNIRPDIKLYHWLIWSRQMSDSLVYLHSKKIVHCAIKPQDFMFHGYYFFDYVVLTNFTQAQNLDSPNIEAVLGCYENYTQDLKDLRYPQIAPEILDDQKITEKADIWSLALIIHELFNGDTEYPHDEPLCDHQTYKQERVPPKISINLCDQILNEFESWVYFILKNHNIGAQLFQECIDLQVIIKNTIINTLFDSLKLDPNLRPNAIEMAKLKTKCITDSTKVGLSTTHIGATQKAKSSVKKDKSSVKKVKLTRIKLDNVDSIDKTIPSHTPTTPLQTTHTSREDFPPKKTMTSSTPDITPNSYQLGFIQSMLSKHNKNKELDKNDTQNNDSISQIVRAFESSTQEFVVQPFLENGSIEDQKPKLEASANVATESGKIKSNQIKENWENKTLNNKNLERDEMTIFIGNLPLEGINSSEIFKHLNLSKNEVVSLRFRSIPIHPKFQKNIKAGCLSKKFSDTISTKNAYVVLKDSHSIDKVLKKDNTQFNGNTIRVDRANRGSQYSTFDVKKTIFVGNLPPLVKEEDLRASFAPYGFVKGVRVIRNRATSTSKGFGFVLFEDRVSVAKSLQAQGTIQVQGREVRITRSMKEEVIKNDTHTYNNKNKAKMKKETYKKLAERGNLKVNPINFKVSPIKKFSENAKRRIENKQKKLTKKQSA